MIKYFYRKTAFFALALFMVMQVPSGYAAFQDDPADPDGDGFTNGEEQLMGTNPAVFDKNLSDTALLTLLQKRAFDFFWLESKAPNYFAPDKGNFNAVGQGSSANSIASTGFSLMAMVVADSNGWVDHVEAYHRVKAVLSRLRDMQKSSDPNLHKHGFFYHFVDSNGYQMNSEISSIDHALLIAGALLAGQYYKGTEAETLSKALYENTEWGFMFNGKFFYQAWTPDGGPAEGGTYSALWDRYSELMILLLEGIGSPTHAVTAQTWNDFSRGTVTYKTLPTYVHCGALFAHQFSHMWVDFRDKKDGFGINYFNNSMNATLVNRQFCIDLNAADPTRYETYGTNSWGLSSAYSSVGYMVIQPDFSNPAMVEWNTDSGTVVPDAAIGSVPFTPAESIGAAQNWFTNFRSITFGRYGFRNSFNFGKPNNSNSLSHFPSEKVSLDCGTDVAMIENFRTGLIWKFFGRNAGIKDGMNKTNFVSDPILWQMNFDNQPTPGQDPNSFGGFSGGFGPGGASSYVQLTSSPPAAPTVGGYVWKIAASGTGGGAYQTLAGHDFSRFDTLSFWIKGNVGGEVVKIGLKDLSNTEYMVPISDYIEGGAVTSEFKGVRIPMRVFTDHKVRLTTMDNISFSFVSPNGGQILVDDIAILPDEIKPVAPAGLKGTISGTDVNLSWAYNEERDVVGYNVYRSASANGAYTKLNDLLVVENSFKDPGILSDPNNQFHYHITAVDNAVVPNESAVSNEVVLPNKGPKLDPIGNKTVIRGNLLAFTVSATDANEDTLTFTASNLPPGAVFDPNTKIFSWNAAQDQVGIYRGIHFSVTDGIFTSSEDITIAVTDNEIGTLDVSVEDISTGNPVLGGINFGTLGANTGLTTSTMLIKFSPMSNLNNWKVHIYTDNSPSMPKPITGGSVAGLVGQKDSSYRAGLKWAVYPAKVNQSELPADPLKWGTVPDWSDTDFGSTQAGRILADAGGTLGNFPATGRQFAGTVFLYLAADFSNTPAQAYKTNALVLEMFKQ